MECPNCKEDMEFEEAKDIHGSWYCCECDYETEGSMIPISDGDGNIEYEERSE